MSKPRPTDSTLVNDYPHGFVSPVAEDTLPPGLNEEIVRAISAKKSEPAWMLDFRLKAYRRWQTRREPHWALATYPPIDYQSLRYYSAPRALGLPGAESGGMDPEVLKTFERLGVPLHEQRQLEGVAIDAVFDSVSVATTHRKMLSDLGIIFCPFSEAVREHPDLVRKYLGSVVPPGDNFYAALNSAVFSDGSFCYVPKGVRCPVDLSTYFRINAAGTGQFERTLIVADEGAVVSYLEGCTAPMRDENQLHAAVVELVALEGASIRYSTVQNWYPGDAEGRGGIYNFVTKRGHCRGNQSHISWTQVEVGSAITWKYPSCILEGDDSTGEFYSVAYTDRKMQADTGTKMIHVGRNTRSTIVSKGISAGRSANTYRSLVHFAPTATRARNHSQCDSLLLGPECTANTFPVIESENPSAILEHEATTSRISADQLFYLQSRGLNPESARSMIVNGFCREVFKRLPLEFSVEAVKLLEIKMEGSIG